MISDTVYTFRPDFVSKKKAILLSVGLVAAIILSLLYASAGDPFSFFDTITDSDDFLLITGLFSSLLLAIIFCIIHIFVEQQRNKDIIYSVSKNGIEITLSGVVARKIPWNNVKEIRVAHGPCEPDSEIISGPYGIYVILENGIGNLYKERNRILNLSFSPDNPQTIRTMCIFEIYRSESLKKCIQVKKQILLLHHGLPEQF